MSDPVLTADSGCGAAGEVVTRILAANTTARIIPESIREGLRW
jgi:hypothetical protein